MSIEPRSTEPRGTEPRGTDSRSGTAVTAQPVQAATRSLSELRADATRARAELAATLEALDRKLNVPRQLRVTRRRITLGLHKLGDENPVGLAGIALSAAVAVGAAVWLGVRAITNR